MSTTNLKPDCIFCKIVTGAIPSSKLIETDNSCAFMDIEPLAKGHVLVIPKYHAEFMHQLPDEYLADAMPVAKQIAVASGLEQYNVLQNNGELANQAVSHVHFHIIPKRDTETGLKLKWDRADLTPEDIEKSFKDIKQKL